MIRFHRRHFLLASGALLGMPLRGVAAGGSEEFDWLPTECADERYPMQLISGELHCRGRIVNVPAGKIVNNGWGEIGSRRLVGKAMKPVPERLMLTWFSFAEDQFYGGNLELPHAELTALFRAGFTEPQAGNRVTWAKVIVGMGLGGWTSVWLAGSGIVREVARAQLGAQTIEWARVIDNPDIPRAEYVRSKLRSRLSEAALAALAQHGPPVASWPRYASQFSWKVQVEGAQTAANLFARSFNGERAYYDFAIQGPQSLRGVPKLLQLTGLGRSDRRLLTTIRLDEAETLDAFDKIASGAPATSAATLRIAFATQTRVALSLDRDTQRISLSRARAEVRSLS